MAQAKKAGKTLTWGAVGRAKRWTEEQGEWVVAEWQRSGQSVQQFASQHGLEPQRVYLWRKRSKASAGRGRSRSRSKVRAEVIEVKLGRAGLPVERRMDIELGSGHRLSVAEHIDVDVLKRVVAALER